MLWPHNLDGNTVVDVALVSAADTQGSRAASRRVRSRVDATEVTFPFKPGDYVVHAARSRRLRR